MVSILRWLAAIVAGAMTVGGLTTGYLATRAAFRDELAARPATVHPSLSRESCIGCHAPIAAEWKQSFHFRSVTGPYWERLRKKGYTRLLGVLRVPCMECHAPANVLDLPAGEPPSRRLEATRLGVDCVSCHVSRRGILGPGRSEAAPHEVIPDERFRDPMLASASLCATCHEEQGDCSKTVSEWRSSRFAREGVSCLDCHMPEIMAPAVAGGAERMRRSHRFPGDKDEATLKKALNAVVLLTGERRAVVRLTNDRTGHSLPASGENWLFMRVTIEDESGNRLRQAERAFGSREIIPGYLDFWPFKKDTAIPPGESRQLEVKLPAGHGTIAAEFRYRDWFAIRDRDRVIASLSREY